MSGIVIFYILDAFVALWMIPIVIIWCVKPNKSLQEGFSDWLNEE
jgi:hypothetical protein